MTRDLNFLKDQITIEVNIARVHNYRVERQERRDAVVA